MKPQKRSLILLAFFATTALLLSSFYPFSDNKKENLSEAQKFKTYYSQIHGQTIPDSPQNIFIIPKSGCPYCEKKLVGSFFNSLKNSPTRKNFILIAAGISSRGIGLKENFQFVQPDFFDPENKAEKFGLYFTAPLCFKTENRQIQSVIHTNANNIDSVLSILNQKIAGLHPFHSSPTD